MRLPMSGEGNHAIDEQEAIRCIRHAIDQGVNYIDTAYMYHGGNSERVVGKALADGYRKKVFLADKMPAWMAEGAGGVEALFKEQLKRLDTDVIDFYLVHNVTRGVWKRVQQLEILRFLEKQKKKGTIRYLGFSFHDQLPFFKEIVDAYPWDFCQIQLNFMDKDFQAGVEGLRYAGEQGLPVVIMEPLKGGKLVQEIPEGVQKIWDASAVKRSPLEWAMRYVTNFPEVLTVLSGMSSFEQTEENVKLFGNLKQNSLTEDDLERYQTVTAEYLKLQKAACTACRYCVPCPSKIFIPDAIDYYNQVHRYRIFDHIKRDYKTAIPEKNRPSNCTDCKECEDKCPQNLPVSGLMKEIADFFGS